MNWIELKIQLLDIGIRMLDTQNENNFIDEKKLSFSKK